MNAPLSWFLTGKTQMKTKDTLGLNNTIRRGTRHEKGKSGLSLSFCKLIGVVLIHHNKRIKDFSVGLPFLVVKDPVLFDALSCGIAHGKGVMHIIVHKEPLSA